MFKGSWQTTLIGVLGGIVAYLVELGPNLPTDSKGWGMAIVAATLAALGFKTKDANVSNSPIPVAAQVVSAESEARPNPAAKG